MNMCHWSMKWLLMLMAATMVAAAQDLSFEGLLKDGVRSYNNGDYKTAAEKFEDAGKLRPDDARVKYNEALSRYMNKEYEAAENGFQTAKEKGYAEDDNFKAVCDLGIGNCHYEKSMQTAKDVEGKQPQEAIKQLQEAKASCEKSIDSYRDALRYSQKLKNAKDNLKTARNQRKEIVKTLRKLEEELKQQPQQQQGDQKQDGEKQDGEQQQQDGQKQDGQQQQQDSQKQDGEQQQQQGEQQQKDAGEQLKELAKRQSEEAEKNEQGQQNQKQAADEQKKLSDETEQTRQAMEQQRKEAEKQDAQSSEKSEAEKKLEEAQDAQKKAEESLEKGDMKSASEAQKEAAEKLDEARKAMSEGEKKDEEEQKQDQQQQEQQQQQLQQEGSEEQMSETDNDIQNILDQERNNQRKRLKLLRVKPVERDW